jgi:hypothetical protein
MRTKRLTNQQQRISDESVDFSFRHEGYCQASLGGALDSSMPFSRAWILLKLIPTSITQTIHLNHPPEAQNTGITISPDNKWTATSIAIVSVRWLPWFAVDAGVLSLAVELVVTPGGEMRLSRESS